jgi:hypothetical protein
MTLYVYSQIIVPASILIPIGVAISRFREIPAYAKWLLSFLVMSAIINTIGTILALNDRHNLWLLHVYTILESFLLLYYFKLIISNKTINIIIRCLLLAFPLFCVINFLFLQSLYSFNTYARPLEAIIIVFLSAVYWWQENEEDSDNSWGNIPNNWFVTGLMLYFAAGVLFLFLFAKYILNERPTKQEGSLVWDTHATLVLVMYLLMAIGFFKCKK